MNHNTNLNNVSRNLLFKKKMCTSIIFYIRVLFMKNASKANIIFTLSSLFARNFLQEVPPHCVHLIMEKSYQMKKGTVYALNLGARGF